MPRRKLSRPGLSYFDANSGRLVTEGPDVLDIKREIEARWPDALSVYFDTIDERWVIIEHCGDGIDRLALQTRFLDWKVVQKLQRMDQATHNLGDINRKYERDDEDAERKKDHALTEATGDAQERFYHALRKDGIIHRPQVSFTGKKAA